MRLHNDVHLTNEIATMDEHVYVCLCDFLSHALCNYWLPMCYVRDISSKLGVRFTVSVG